MLDQALDISTLCIISILSGILPESTIEVQTSPLPHIWSSSGYLLVPKPGVVCVLRVIVLLEDEPLPQSEVLSALEQVFIKELSVLGSVRLSLYPD